MEKDAHVFHVKIHVNLDKKLSKLKTKIKKQAKENVVLPKKDATVKNHTASSDIASAIIKE